MFQTSASGSRFPYILIPLTYGQYLCLSWPHALRCLPHPSESATPTEVGALTWFAGTDWREPLSLCSIEEFNVDSVFIFFLHRTFSIDQIIAWKSSFHSPSKCWHRKKLHDLFLPVGQCSWAIFATYFRTSSRGDLQSASHIRSLNEAREAAIWWALLYGY